jgi:hypothetical protein
MKNIKYYLLPALIVLVITAIASCKRNDGYNTPISGDKTKPGVITDIKVTDYNGGSFITYTLPKSPNILYIQAKYEIRPGVFRETKSSYYSDTLNVEGFAKEQEYKVSVYTVSRANVSSDPVTVTVHPKIPVFTMVRATTKIQADFGGVGIFALNPLRKSVGVILTKYDSVSRTMKIFDQHYTKDSLINYSVRGLNVNPRNFGIYVTDKFENISDTLKSTIAPLFEQLLDKSLFSPFKLASDTPLGYEFLGWTLKNLWDDSTDGSQAGWHTEPGRTPPFVCTFGVGKTYKLSRFVLWERPDDAGGGDKYAFGHGNPRLFSLWGSNSAVPKDAKLPVSAPEGTVLGDWVNLGNFTYPNPPSGQSAVNHTDSDNAFVLAGVNFNVSINAPEIRFIRLSVAETWSKGDFAHVMEISLYGGPK